MTETHPPTTEWSEAKRSLLAQRLRGGRGRGRTVDRRPEGTAPPLSSSQERLWFMEQFTPGSTAYTLAPARRVRGPYDRIALDAALTDLVARHEVLRTVFPATDDGTAHAVVAEPAPFGAEFLDVSQEPDPAVREALATDAVGQLVARPFVLAEGPLLRVLLVRIGEQDHVLALALHHIVCDGWSIDLLQRELDALHAHHTDGTPHGLAEPRLQYGDYAAWQRGRLADGALTASRDHWRAELDGVPALELPVDRPRPPTFTFEGAAHEFRWDKALSERVTAVAAAYGASRYMVLMAAYQALLSRHSGQGDFAVGSPVAGRLHSELEPLVGIFVNMLPIRARITPDLTFARLLGQVRERTLDAYAHQEVPFEQIVSDLAVERDVSRAAVFQATLAFQNYGEQAVGTTSGTTTAPGTPRAEGFGYRATTTHHDLALYLRDEADGGVYGLFTYRTDLFDATTVERLAERFEVLLTAALADPDRTLGALPLLADGERARLAAWSAGPPPTAEGPATLGELLARAAAATPGAVALTDGRDSLTYGELERRATGLGHRLRALGAGPGAVVALCLEQSPDLAVAMLGVLKAGAAYLPLDPEQPTARVEFLLADAGVTVLVTDPVLAAKAPGFRGSVLHLDPAAESAAGAEPLPPTAGPGDLAYVIYTSGSTGTPKGVAVQHRQILTYLAGARERLRVEDGGVYGLLQSLAFDFSITLLYLGLSTGGRVHLLPRRISGAELADRIEESGIDYLKMTPSHLAALTADAPTERLLPRKALVLGGEASSAAWASGLAALGRCAVFNHYGPTETTVGVTVHEVAPDGPRHGSTPIGRPLAGARTYVLDAALRPVPQGVTGELHVGGDRLARGYLGRPGLTADRFVPDPFTDEPGARMYRTGDLVRQRADGELEFLGRADHQIKVRGYRVEPGEIEAALAAVDGVGQAVVIARGEGVKQQLVGYLERSGDGEPPAPAELRTRLLDVLPDYMIPARYVVLDRLPLLAHGKVDRAALPAPEDSGAGTGEDLPPEGATEELIASLWADLLDVEHIGALDDFFVLGGHSLMATQVVARLRRALPEQAAGLGVMDLFQHATVRALAALLDSSDEDRGPRKLLHRLTPPRTRTTGSVVCAPYGGGSALIYKPLADALPADWALHSLAVPGHELGEEARPFDEVAAETAQEILDGVEGRIVLYGHCGLGVMLIVEVARRLEAAGREVDAVHLGGIFPFARPESRGAVLAERFSAFVDRLRSDQDMVNALTAAGLDTDDFSAEQLRLIVHNRRTGTKEAERYFGELFRTEGGRLRAPVIAVAGDRDPATEFYQERYREWHRLTDTAAVVVLDEAGHFFLKYRAEELAVVLTEVAPAVAEGDDRRHARTPGATWWLEGVSREGEGQGTRDRESAAGASAGAEAPAAAREAGAAPDAGAAHDDRTVVRPSLGRFLAVATGQQVSMIGSALTEFALPIWIYLRTGSLTSFGLLAACALVPGILAAPLAGAVVDRSDRRKVMLAGDLAAGATQAALLVLYLTDSLHVWHAYTLIALLSLALVFQRFAWGSSVPQLVPKRFLGRANGVTQMALGFAQFLVPLFAVGLLAGIGLGGILVIDVISYTAAVAITLAVRFPKAMAAVRRESVLEEIKGGFRRALGSRHFRAMLLFFAALNIFLSPLFLLTTPLVLSFADLAATGWVAVAAGAGAVVGGLTLLIWGGPRHHRLRGVLYATAGLAVACVLTGLRPSLPLVALGAFGMTLGLALLNGTYATIIQTKVPLRFHGRIIAVNTMVAWSTLPVGFAVIAPFAPGLLQPLMEEHGALAGTVGQVIGTGEGRGIGLLYLLFGLAMALLAVTCLRIPVLARFDREVPDAVSDDLVGLETLQARTKDKVAHDSGR
ncbi:non-ribosomal peptide synthetase/MFS transporter [Streptomyces liangshanensis]|uniref:Amino acid adenylation domain-containing protein n=1 Tax=Streptomyces liangshanensis TaxID=2717324 RepID=A0A6G9GWG1_9ACTN|nr:non-ribosomal peptide synthetase/MFS transporter [Streptomyces liangshanensis]QIQ02257.1 amino acid adenylation domain-containing protein [Streptomyces liangshanensis]